MPTTTFKTVLTLLAFATGALSVACDRGAPTDDVEPNQFRTVPPVLKIKSAVVKLKVTGCDARFEAWQEGIEYAPAEWRGMMEHTAKLQGEEMLRASFLADEETEGMCKLACDEEGLTWDGGAAVLEGYGVEAGDVSIVGECPFDALATSMDVYAEGEVGCTCAG